MIAPKNRGEIRAIFDANIWISYLLTQDETRTIRQVVNLCFTRGIQLLLPEELIQELTETIDKYPHLAKRITQEDIAGLVVQFRQVALTPPSLRHELEQYTRDPKDEYLVAYGLIYDCDYLVTGDADMLILQRVQNLQIVKPVEFLQIARNL
jgi:uncharacterized protein